MVVKKKKILIVTFPQGGPRVWAENLAKHLRGRGFDATVGSLIKSCHFNFYITEKPIIFFANAKGYP